MAQKQYALVSSGMMALHEGVPVISGFFDEPPRGFPTFCPPDSEWLPVENFDSMEFDPRRHFRSEPSYEVRGRIVARLYLVFLIGGRA